MFRLRGMFLATAVSAVLSATLTVPATAAPTDEVEVKTFNLPQGTQLTVDNFDTFQPDPWLTPDEVHRRRYNQYYTIDSRQFSDSAPQQKLAGDIWTECAQRKIDRPGKPWVRDHYAFCTKGEIGFSRKETSVLGKKLVYELTIPYTAVGIGSKNERKVDLNIHLHTDKIKRDDPEGKMPPDPVLDMEIFCKDLFTDGDPAAAKTCTVNNNQPGVPATITRRLSELMSAPSDYAFTFTSDDSQAGWSPTQVQRSGPEKVVASNIGMGFHWSGSTGTPSGINGFQTSARFDSADYLKYGSDPGVGGQGAVFYDVIPSIEYRVGDTEVSEIAQHIWDALNAPDRTVPLNPNKWVPGGSNNEDDTLARLRWNRTVTPWVPWGDEVGRIADNRRKALDVCERNEGAGEPGPGKQCDEFPFARTFQGAAHSDYDPVAPLNWSARWVDGDQNVAAGSRLGRWFGNDRILDWSYDGRLQDDFFVRVPDGS